MPERGERLFAYRCEACGLLGLLPVLGQALVQQGSWIIFESEEQAVPALAECAHCSARYGVEAQPEPARQPPLPAPRAPRRHLHAVSGRAC